MGRLTSAFALFALGGTLWAIYETRSPAPPTAVRKNSSTTEKTLAATAEFLGSNSPEAQGLVHRQRLSPAEPEAGTGASLPISLKDRTLELVRDLDPRFRRAKSPRPLVRWVAFSLARNKLDYDLVPGQVPGSLREETVQALLRDPAGSARDVEAVLQDLPKDAMERGPLLEAVYQMQLEGGELDSQTQSTFRAIAERELALPVAASSEDRVQLATMIYLSAEKNREIRVRFLQNGLRNQSDPLIVGYLENALASETLAAQGRLSPDPGGM